MLERDDEWKEYGGHKVWLNYEDPNLRGWPPDVRVLRPTRARDGKSTWSKSLAAGLYRGTNAGSSALNLADILGADTIYLLGFDFYGEEGKTKNWHEKYAKEWKQQERVYQSFMQDFAVLARSGELRSKVVNLNPASRLRCFEFGNIFEVLPGLTASPLQWKPPVPADPVVRKKLTPASVEGFQGLGDTIYMRPCIKKLLEQHSVVYLDTPWPQLFWDMPNVLPVRPRNLALRTQAANARVQNSTTWRWRPSGLPTYKFGYTVEDMRGGYTPLTAMMKCLSVSDPVDFSMAVNPEWAPTWLASVRRPLGVIHPATVRKEWENPSRCPSQSHLQAIIDAHPEVTWVSVAWLAEGQEWLSGPPLHGVQYEFNRGELPMEQVLAVLAAADVAVAGPCFMLPAAAAVGTHMLCVFGGSIHANALIDRRMGPYVTPITPMPFCNCWRHNHDCNKAIPHDRLLGAFNMVLDRAMAKQVV